MKKWMALLCVSLLVVSVAVNVYFLSHHRSSSTPVDREIHGDQTIQAIETYLDSISPSYIADEKMLATKYNVSSLGCGPSSYALAKILNKKFFNDTLVISAIYNKVEPYQIVERFSFAQDKGKIGDHSWLEIYFKDKFLFIDPTAAQFGTSDKIAYEVFQVGDPALQTTLNTKYHIVDMRLSLLVNKVINRIPTDQSPYPGATISQGDLNYFLRDLDVRNEVEKNIEPVEWHDWVAYLLAKYNT